VVESGRAAFSRRDARLIANQYDWHKTQLDYPMCSISMDVSEMQQARDRRIRGLDVRG
jgi:hypothetical protein